MSEHLKAFLTAYVAWIDAGAPDEAPFSRETGLCSNFENQLLEGEFSYRQAEDEVDALTLIFKNEGLNRWYPFGGESVYYMALTEGEQHLNQARIDWVRSKVAQYEAV